MRLFHWLNNWYDQHGPQKLPPLPLFNGKTLDELLPPNPNAGENDGNGEGTIASGEPIPVEPNGGIGDGAIPLPGPIDSGSGIGDGADPIPVEPDGGIGDGAGPIPDGFANTLEGGGEGSSGNDLFLGTNEAETFMFESGGGNDAVSGFNLDNDTLDLSKTEFSNVKDLLAASADVGTLGYVIPTFSELDEGVLIKTGEGAYGYLEGVTLADLETMDITFA